MWDKPFEIEMLANENGVVINCPSVEAYIEMARVLDEHGFRFGNGVSPIEEDIDWVEHGEDFCFYAKGSRIYYGPKYSTEQAPWRSYTKCTFYGATSDFEPADDNEMSKFLGF